MLRIYGRTHGEQALEAVLTDTVVFTLLSERKLGPKLHGIFPGGRIEQYIPVSNSRVHFIIYFVVYAVIPHVMIWHGQLELNRIDSVILAQMGIDIVSLCHILI